MVIHVSPIIVDWYPMCVFIHQHNNHMAEPRHRARSSPHTHTQTLTMEFTCENLYANGANFFRSFSAARRYTATWRIRLHIPACLRRSTTTAKLRYWKSICFGSLLAAKLYQWGRRRRDAPISTIDAHIQTVWFVHTSWKRSRPELAIHSYGDARSTRRNDTNLFQFFCSALPHLFVIVVAYEHEWDS